MLYPHEREEQKLLIGSIIDKAREYNQIIAFAAFLVGLSAIFFGIVDSFLLHKSVVPWKVTWTIGFVVNAISFCLYLVWRSQKNESRFLSKRKTFVLRTLTPYAIVGAVLGVYMSTLTYSALMLMIFYVLALLAISSYSLPRLRNFAVFLLIFTLSCIVITARHDISDIDDRHLANLLLMCGLGLPHLTLGTWCYFLKKV